jgi:hypothetical protein
MYLCPMLPTLREWLFHRSSSLPSILDFLLALVYTAQDCSLVHASYAIYDNMLYPVSLVSSSYLFNFIYELYVRSLEIPPVANCVKDGQ